MLEFKGALREKWLQWLFWLQLMIFVFVAMVAAALKPEDVQLLNFVPNNDGLGTYNFELVLYLSDLLSLSVTNFCSFR